MATPGFVYVLANPSINGIVKIGKTRQKPVERAKEISSAPGVPTPFLVVYHACFEDYDQAEKFVHNRLENFRVSNNHEFFKVEIPVAVKAVVEAIRKFGEMENDKMFSRKDATNDQNIDFEPITFGKLQESEKGFYELLDIFMGHSMRGWSNFVKSKSLSMPQFSILMQLYYRGAFSVSDISDRFGISVPAASQLVEKLVQAGYLERAEDPNDRRARLLPLSSKGKKLIEQGFKRRYQWMDELLSGLTAEERDHVVDALTVLTKRAKEIEN